MPHWNNQSSVVLWIWIGIGILSLTTLFITLLVLNYLKSIKKNKRKVIQLVRNTQTECLEDLLYLQERDRERLAEELHDNIISSLNLIRLNINYKNPTELNLDLKRSMQHIRELSHNLTPPDLNEIELADLITDYLEQAGKSIEMKYHIVTAETMISSAVKLNIFRIVQELTTNILKHADASKIDLFLKTSAQYLTLTVEDNGIGFIPADQSGGIGLRNINSRARQIGAVYKFKTNPEKGTKFIIRASIK
ncbi:two-component system NarL family sensor kinase [Chryseobacterium sp. H1D6B]|uniref:sensor histidine kinase n=1 Tax=Chryseobacterium sp. H1D6B TaxID=2940588 RepID=UPI0015CE6E99|nr:ATP-binding protein [Chryseobacterium sp. H1D6B]MDH6250303.1 two-component system NarL family sensor kinase [Chryseobacterium sp. H1D6B]